MTLTNAVLLVILDKDRTGRAPEMSEAGILLPSLALPVINIPEHCAVPCYLDALSATFFNLRERTRQASSIAGRRER